MRFLADENFPGTAVRALQEAGHDIVSVADAAPGSGDADVLRRAAREGRILLTFDKDFDEPARNAALPVICGVMFWRVAMARPCEVGTSLVSLIKIRDAWAGHFSVIELGRVSCIGSHCRVSTRYPPAKPRELLVTLEGARRACPKN
jgi:hypothetical protein